MNVELLSRIQFAFTIMFHYIFPPFSIGIGLLLVIYESLFLITKQKVYEDITRFWIKLFAATFSVGVASGIVMEFQFGTNWASYARFVGDVFGSPLAAEGIFAFFLESGFLAILLFGWNRVKPGVHLFSTIMVALGSILSAFWIVVANSWQQTPVAYEIVQHGEGTRAVITDFWAMVFNPSSMVRFSHVIFGAFIQGSFFAVSVAAFYLLKNKHVEFAKKSFAIAISVAAIASVTQVLIGHSHSVEVGQYQPAKLAAFEGVYETGQNVPLHVIGHTDSDKKETYGIAVPGMLSFLLGGTTSTTVKGLNEFPRDEWPPVATVFHSYHIMIALGMFFIAFTLFCIVMLLRKKLFEMRWALWISVFAVVLPVIANQIGWVAAEVGRQPWVVYGLLKTSDGISKSINATDVWISLILFFLVYTLLFFVWVFVLDREIKHGPGFHGAPEVGYTFKGQRLDALDEDKLK